MQCLAHQMIKWEGLNAEMLMGFKEMDMDDDVREEYPYPFCSEYFDIVGLYCHIDDKHPVEANNVRSSPQLFRVCPICVMRVGVDMVAHITLQHGNNFKMSFLSVTLFLKLTMKKIEDKDAETYFLCEHCVKVTHFRALERPKEDEFCLALCFPVHRGKLF